MWHARWLTSLTVLHFTIVFMALIQLQDIKELTEKRGDVCLSLYLATHRDASHQKQDQTGIKVLLTNAKPALEALCSEEEYESIMGFINTLLKDTSIWKHPYDGLAVFATKDYVRYYSVPYAFKNEILIQDQFYIKPLIPLLYEPGHAYILALHKDNVQLFRANPYNVVEVSLPSWLAEEMIPPQPHKQENSYHTLGSTPMGNGDKENRSITHGVQEENEKVYMQRFFRKVDQAVNEVLLNDRAPLFLSGVKYERDLYANISRYPYLEDHGLKATVNGTSLTELSNEAWQALHKHNGDHERETLQLFANLHDSERVSTNFKEVLNFLTDGRVQILFVNADTKVMGNYSEEGRTFNITLDHAMNVKDLTETAIRKGIDTNAKVLVIDSARMPDHVTAAAILRY